jgi:hypothetical protein
LLEMQPTGPSVGSGTTLTRRKANANPRIPRVLQPPLRTATPRTPSFRRAFRIQTWPCCSSNTTLPPMDSHPPILIRWAFPCLPRLACIHLEPCSHPLGPHLRESRHLPVLLDRPYPARRHRREWSPITLTLLHLRTPFRPQATVLRCNRRQRSPNKPTTSTTRRLPGIPRIGPRTTPALVIRLRRRPDRPLRRLAPARSHRVSSRTSRREMRVKKVWLRRPKGPVQKKKMGREFCIPCVLYLCAIRFFFSFLFFPFSFPAHACSFYCLPALSLSLSFGSLAMRCRHRRSALVSRFGCTAARHNFCRYSKKLTHTYISPLGCLFPFYLFFSFYSIQENESTHLLFRRVFDCNWYRPKSPRLM